MELTNLEKQVLLEINWITDGLGEEDKFIYKCLKEEGYDMKVVRGVLASLEKKNKIYFDEDYVGNVVTRRYIYINN